MAGSSDALLRRIEMLGWPELGQSSEGRPIRGRLLGGSDEPPLVVVGGVHGDEPSSVEALLDLVARSSGGPEPSGPLWVIPVLNPDGVAAGRKNSARDVDLNRNFPASSFTVEHRPGYYPGDRPGSEPETRLLMQLVERTSPWGVIAVHAPFACINYDGPAAAWAQVVADACGWPARADIGYPTPGSLGSWLGRDRGLPILTVELPPGPLAGFREPALRALAAAVAWDRSGMQPA